MKIIGERISILEKDGLLSVVILPARDNKKLFFMFLWLMAWTVCGVIVMAYYFKLQTKEQKLFTIVYLSFWLYFEFKITRAFIWRRWGREKLWIQNGFVHYQQEVNGKGRIKKFDRELIESFEYIDTANHNFSDFINQSFWIKGGERIKFECQGRQIRLGLQLKDQEAKNLLKALNAFLKKSVK